MGIPDNEQLLNLMLWLCLSLPHLPLEIFSRAGVAEAPWVVSHGKGVRQQVLIGNTIAETLGIQPGMSLRAAYGLAGDLRVHSRDEAQEGAALEGLAAWAGQFTSFVSLLPPRALLLEIQGSLRIFGGVHALLERIRAGIAELGHHAQIGVAPTPLGAWMLARASIDIPVTTAEELVRAVRALPLEMLLVEEKTLEALRGVGLRCVGDLLNLPRDGVARRFGPALLHDLDRMLGRVPDPRRPYVPPASFSRELVLPAETADCAVLLFPAHRLLLELAGFLAARQAGTQCLKWELRHHRQASTHITLGLSAPSRDARHLLSLFRERLERHPLAHAVEGIGLGVTDIRPVEPQSLSLHGEAESRAEEPAHLLERLRARLGDGAVSGLQCWPDHRPERAWRCCEPGHDNPALRYPPRPVWLLPQPVALSVREGMPWLDGCITLLQGPERIESGWWDGEDVARDYFIASDASHARLWIYRERRNEQQWFLHGVFG